VKAPRRESRAALRERAARIVERLHALYPDADCALRHESALELLEATILSAQCTDERVNQVTPELFRTYPTADALARASTAELEALIRPTGFFRNKARSLIGLGRALVERHGGEVPDSMEALVPLPGVGRKTANVVLGTWFGKPAIPVDTHVTRLSGRLELSRNTDPVRIERDLMDLLPAREWTFTSHALIWHGRRVCKAARPLCGACGVRPWCPWPDRQASRPRRSL
jgi:endonuclease-3